MLPNSRFLMSQPSTGFVSFSRSKFRGLRWWWHRFKAKTISYRPVEFGNEETSVQLSLAEHFPHWEHSTATWWEIRRKRKETTVLSISKMETPWELLWSCHNLSLSLLFILGMFVQLRAHLQHQGQHPNQQVYSGDGSNTGLHFTLHKMLL